MNFMNGRIMREHVKKPNSSYFEAKVKFFLKGKKEIKKINKRRNNFLQILNT